MYTLLFEGFVFHLLTVYDEHLLQRLTQAGFVPGPVPRTVLIDEEFWTEIRRESANPISVEDALCRALQKRIVSDGGVAGLGGIPPARLA